MGNHGRNQSSRTVAWLAPILFALFLLLVWWAATNLREVEPWVFPTPQAFGRRAATLLGEKWLWDRVWVTASEALVGSLIGSAVAIPLAWAIFRSNIIRAAIEPFLGATQAIPAIALAPLLVLWIGYGFIPIVSLCSLIVFFPVLVATTVGLRQMDQDIIEAASLDGAGGWRMIWSIEMPLVAPSMLGGIRNGFALSVTGAVVGEMVMGGTGLAQTLTQQRQNLDTAGMFVTVGLLCILAMTLYGFIYYFERRLKQDVGRTTRVHKSFFTKDLEDSQTK